MSRCDTSSESDTTRLWLCDDVKRFYRMNVACCQECHKFGETVPVDLPNGQAAEICCRVEARLVEKILA